MSGGDVFFPVPWHSIPFRFSLPSRTIFIGFSIGKKIIKNNL